MTKTNKNEKITIVPNQKQRKMVKSAIVSFILIVTLSIPACSLGVSGLQRYIDKNDAYEFLYPNGWIPVEVENSSKGVDTVFRDIIEKTENLSVIINCVPQEQNLKKLGTPSEVGYRFMQEVNKNNKYDRQAELINAEERQINSNNYYELEYKVELANKQTRHNLASVVVSRGKLYTFNISTKENRWEKVKQLFETVVKSFEVY